MLVRPFGVWGVAQLDNQLAQRIYGGGLEPVSASTRGCC